MPRLLQIVSAGLFLLFLLGGSLAAQVENGDDPSLGDLARSLRKHKAAPEQTIIDNDNMSKIMEEVASRRHTGLVFSIDEVGKNFQVSAAPDVTCNLSFSANATPLLTNSFVAQELPESELAKLDGPATIHGETLELSLYNGTSWNVKEVTVGLTILRHPQVDNAQYAPARLITATQKTAVEGEKHPDVTVLYHLKGSAAAFTTTVFDEALGAALSSDQDWHWAIVKAKGIPPAASKTPTATSDSGP